MAKQKRPKANPHVVTNSATIRIKEARSRDRTPRQNPLVIIAPDELVGGFINFLRSHTIITLAVGFVIATQVQAVVKQLVSSFITPTYQLFFKGVLSRDTLTWHISGRIVNYNWGLFVNDLLDFFFVLTVIYLIIRFFRLDKIDKPTSK